MEFNTTIDINISDYPFVKEIPIEDLACIKLNDWLVHTGLVIIFAYIALTWLSWWYFNHGYKRFPYDNKFLGNVQRKENRIYWSVFIRDRLLKVCVGYIAILVYLTITGSL